MAIIERDPPRSEEALTEAIRAEEADGWSPPGIVLLAALCAAVGAIHIAMAAAHLSDWMAAGALFALAGWSQLGLAAALLARPSRRTLFASWTVTMVLISAWLVTRVWGWPFGPDAGVPEEAEFVDLTAVLLEVGVVVGSLALLAAPRLGDGRNRTARMAVSATASAGALILATAAIASPSAARHENAHGEAPAGATAAMADDHSAAGHPHEAGTVTVDDKGLGMLHNGEHEEMTYTTLSARDQAGVDHLVSISEEVIEQYPTLGSFKAAGATRAGPYLPGLGIHYMLITAESFNPDGVMDENDMRHPLTIIYDGTDDTSKIAGFMYYSLSPTVPEGFPGTNDYWHFHSDVCDVTTPSGEIAYIGTNGVLAPKACAALGGRYMASTAYMVHVWSVPGYEVADADGGMFAEINPKLTCPDGTYYTMTELKDMIDHPFNACLSELTNPTAPVGWVTPPPAG